MRRLLIGLILGITATGGSAVAKIATMPPDAKMVTARLDTKIVTVRPDTMVRFVGVDASCRLVVTQAPFTAIGQRKRGPIVACGRTSQDEGSRQLFITSFHFAVGTQPDATNGFRIPYKVARAP